LGRGDPHIQILKMCFLDYIPDYLLNKMEKRNFSLLFDAKDERLVLQIRECYFCDGLPQPRLLLIPNRGIFYPHLQNQVPGLTS
jgi:hypothetical protein